MPESDEFDELHQKALAEANTKFSDGTAEVVLTLAHRAVSQSYEHPIQPQKPAVFSPHPEVQRRLEQAIGSMRAQASAMQRTLALQLYERCGVSRETAAALVDFFSLR